MAFENPFLRQSSVRNSALDYLFSDEPEGDSVQAPTPSNSYAYATPSNNAPDTSVISQVFGLTNLFEGGEGGEGGWENYNPSTGQGPIGIGKATDAIRNKALLNAALGFLTGGVPGAIQKGANSLVSGAHGFLDRVNATEDPLAAWAIEQGWAPVPEVNMETPYGGGAPTGTPAAVTSPVDMSFSPTTPIGPMAVTSPVDMSFNPTLPIAPMGMFSSATAEAQAQAQAAAQADAQAAENDAIAAQAQAQAAAQAQATINSQNTISDNALAAQAQAVAQAQAQAQAQAAAQADAQAAENDAIAAQAQAQAQAAAQAASIARVLNNRSSGGGGGSFGEYGGGGGVDGGGYNGGASM